VAVCSAVEHHAVLHATEAVGGRVVRVNADGIVDLDALRDALDPTVRIVSVMLANNEVGIVQPLSEIAALVRASAPHAVVHTDAVQAFPWLDVAALASQCDLIAISAHKFGGPKGVGALVVREGTKIAPLIHGGGQERERRSGTHNVAGIVGMAAAVESTVSTRAATVARVGALRDRLLDRLSDDVDAMIETGSRANKVAGNAHVQFPTIESESLLVLLDEMGVCASAGSACASGAIEPSHVLLAMGVPRGDALSALRLSLGYDTTEADVDVALKAIPEAIYRLARSR
jgi:cysteine desulfurase